MFACLRFRSYGFLPFSQTGDTKCETGKLLRLVLLYANIKSYTADAGPPSGPNRRKLPYPQQREAPSYDTEIAGPLGVSAGISREPNSIRPNTNMPRGPYPHGFAVSKGTLSTEHRGLG